MVAETGSIADWEETPATPGTRPEARDDRWGFFGWGRLFFFAMAGLRGMEFNAKVDNRLTHPTRCVKNPRGYNI